MNWINGILFALTALLIVFTVFFIIKKRYKKFTSREFVLFFRKGRLKSSGFGGSYFLLPIIDELIVLTTVVQTLEVNAGEVITQENQDVIVNGFVIWRIAVPSEAYRSFTGGTTGLMPEINKTLERLVESIIRTTVAKLSIDQVLRERALIIEAIMAELVPVVEPLGIEISTAEIRHVEVKDEKLFQDLQENYRQEARLAAQTKIIESDKQIQIATALKEEIGRVRELQKDREVLLEEQKLNEAEELRKRSVQELQMQREKAVAEIQKEKLEVEAKTKLMQIEYEAESKKRQHILQNIEVEAQQKKILAEADAEAIKVQAEARREATEMDAEAEAFKLSKIAAARKESLLAEAVGQKAVLLAEAEGLREKVKAQGLINEAMIMQDLVNQLPAIAASMKVGDISWLNMGGSGGSDGKGGESPLGIIPKNLLQIMTMAKTFGLDIEGLIRSIRGKDPLTPNGEDSESEEFIPLPADEAEVTNTL